MDAGVDTAVLFGKSWLLHVKDVLKASDDENIEIIRDSVSYLRSHGLNVLFDAEHFYQGFLDNREYALKVLKTAADAGSDTIVLADTNGGTPPNEIYRITKDVIASMKGRIGVHMHNDLGCAVSNTIMGVVAGATHVQGTINGIGERTGNADLIQIIPALSLRLGYNVLSAEKLLLLKKISLLLYELTGMQPNPMQPFVGENAFAHKAGVHVDAVLKNSRAYEHIDPSLVGNSRKIIISEVSGVSNLVGYAERFGIKLDKTDENLKKALVRIKEKEREGYSFDLAPESALLILLSELGMYKSYINLDYWKVISEHGLNIAVVKTGGVVEVAEGVGPVDAIDIAIRKAFHRIYPEMSKIKLVDYRVVLPGDIKNTQSVVRVTIEFSNGGGSWRTMGISTNIIAASVSALVDGLNYYLWHKDNPSK